MAEATRKMDDQEREIHRLAEELGVQTLEMEQHQFTIDTAHNRSQEDASTISSLRNELTSLKEQMSRASALQALTKGSQAPREPPSPTVANGLRVFEHAANGYGNLPSSSSRRRLRRHSGPVNGVPGHARNDSLDDDMPMKGNPRAVSVMLGQNGPPRPRDSNGLPTVSDGGEDEIYRLLEDEQGLEEDVLRGLITDLKIPAASLHNPPLVKEVIFPAHLISLVANEMWKLGMIFESERFLANVMQSIQNHVMVSHPSISEGKCAEDCRHSKGKTASFQACSGCQTSRRSCHSSVWPRQTPVKA